MAALEVTIIEKWKVGYDHKRKCAVVIFDFEKRSPVGYAIPLPEVEKIGRALLNLNTEGVPSPARPS